MRQAGRYLPEYRRLRAQAEDFVSFVANPKLAAEATLQPIQRFGFDAAIVFSDILLLPAALGQTLHFTEERGPRLAPPVTTGADLIRLTPENLLAGLSPTLETLALARSRLSSETALIGFAGAPWTVACYMCRGETDALPGAAKCFWYREEENFRHLLDLLTHATIDYLKAQVEAGADAIQLFESWAGELPPELFRAVSLAPLSRIAAALRETYPRLPILLYSRGGGILQRLYLECPVSALGLDTATPLDWARDELQPHVAVQGNLDPCLLLCGGEAMERQVDRILTTLAGGRFIFNLGHGILPNTPPAHVERLVKLVRAFPQGKPCL